jgi:hypothetical protein
MSAIIQGTLSLSPNASIPGDRGGIVTTTWGTTLQDGTPRPFFIQSVEGWFTPTEGGVPKKLRVRFPLASGVPSSLGGLVQVDGDGCPLAATEPTPTKGGHQHQVLVRVSRAQVQCELELAAKAPDAPNAVDEYTAWEWKVRTPFQADEALPRVAGKRFIRASAFAEAPAATVDANTEVDGI